MKTLYCLTFGKPGKCHRQVRLITIKQMVETTDGETITTLNWRIGRCSVACKIGKSTTRHYNSATSQA